MVVMYKLTNRDRIVGTAMATERAAGLPSVVLYVLPPLSMLALLGAIKFSNNTVLVALFGALWGVILFAEFVVLPACFFAFVRYPHLRSWTQAGGLTLIATHLLLMFGGALIGVGGGI